MNTGEPYERRTDRTAPEPPAPGNAAEIAALAVHRDPSLAADPTRAAQPAQQGRPTIVWVRPTDLVATSGAARLRQVVDAQADVVRRSRRVPLTAASRLRGRVSRSAIAQTEPTVPTNTPPPEGVQL